MPINCPTYSPEFRQQVTGLARAGRDSVILSKKFVSTAETIRKWFAAANRQEGGRRSGDAPAAAGDGLYATERDELAWLRRENRQLREQRAILSRAMASFARDRGHAVRLFVLMSANVEPRGSPDQSNRLKDHQAPHVWPRQSRPAQKVSF